MNKDEFHIIIDNLAQEVEVDMLIPDEIKLIEHQSPSKPSEVVESDADEEIIRKDEEFVRNNMIETINTAMKTLNSLSEIAEQSAHPRAFEVLTSLIGQTMDANKKLLDIHEKKERAPKDSPKTVNNNAIFVGSTSELLDMIKEGQQKLDAEK